MRKFFRDLWFYITLPFRLIFILFRRIIKSFRDLGSETHDFFAEEVDDAPVGDALSKAWDHPQELLVHIDALRKHLLRAVIALVLTTALSFIFFNQILAFLTVPLKGEKLVAIEVTEPIGSAMKVSLLSGIALAFPYIAFEVFLFIAPGLSRNSRIYGLFAIPVATVFFIGGMAFAYYIMLPAALPFLLNFIKGITTIPRPKAYLDFVTAILFWLGVFFEFPLVVFLLAKLRLVKASQLLKQWRIAVVAIAVIAAAITPTIDPINMSLVMFPMIFLYFFSVFLAKIAWPREIA